MASQPPASKRRGRSSRLRFVVECSSADGPRRLAMTMSAASCGLACMRMGRQPWTLSPEAIPALSVRLPDWAGQAVIPTSPDISLPWSAACGPGGWSAKMFLHQMLLTSSPGWRPSDTERLLSRSILCCLRVRTGGGRSPSDILDPSPPDSAHLYTSLRSIRRGLLAITKYRKPFRALWSRTATGWQRSRVSASSRDAECASSPSLSVSGLPGFPADGPPVSPDTALAMLSGTHSLHPSLNGSEDGLWKRK